MSRRHLRRAALVCGGLGLAALACYQDPTSPAFCPDFCPRGGIVAVESLLATAVSRDSAFQGYVPAHQAAMLLTTSQSGLESRPIFETAGIITRVPIDTGTDTTTGPIVVDSMRLTFTLFRRNARNLRLAFYQLPLGIDSASTFAGLDPAFAAAPLRVVNIDTLLAQPARRDTITGDSVLSVDSIRRAVGLRLVFTAAQSPYSEADSGKLAIGVALIADESPSVALASNELGAGPSVTWFYGVDSAGTILRPDKLSHPFQVSQTRGARFDGFVHNAPPVVIDQDLTVGGVPSTRSLLRIDLPRRLRDSTQIIRAILQLVPTASGALAAPDSVFVQALPLLADLGAKSPNGGGDSLSRSRPFLGVPGDTVRVELTSLFRAWQSDTTTVTAVYLSLGALDRLDSLRAAGVEAGSLGVVRFFSSRTAVLRPSVLLTFVPRVRFGAP